MNVYVKKIIWIDSTIREGYVVFEYSGIILSAFCYLCDPKIKEGNYVNIELITNICSSVDYNQTFQKNEDCLKKIIPIPNEDASYEIYGQLINLDPVIVDCGIILEIDTFGYKEEVLLNKGCYFYIDRLDIELKK